MHTIGWRGSPFAANGQMIGRNFSGVFLVGVAQIHAAYSFPFFFLFALSALIVCCAGSMAAVGNKRRFQ